MLVAGVDEVGRGPLAGPVVAAAVILDPAKPIEGLADCKKLSEKKREALFEVIKERSLAYAIARCDAQEIDSINILQASLLAMQRAVETLRQQPTKVVVDGIHCPKLSIPMEAIVKGDEKVAEISAASILAKVTRDREMVALHDCFPQYGFAQHKGYPTKLHLAALAEHGPTMYHRRSFGPVKRLLQA